MRAITWISRNTGGFAIFAISSLLAFGAAELTLRLLGIGYGNAPIEASSRLHHVHPASYKFYVHDPSGEYGGFRVAYDSDRYRIPIQRVSNHAVSVERKIAFLGDSFTEANQVAWEDSFVGIVEATKPNVTVRNFGVSSYSPILYLVQCKTELRGFEPTDIIVQIFHNDFANDNEYIKSANSDRVAELTSVDGDARSFVIKILRYSYLARLIRKVQLQLTYDAQDLDGPHKRSEVENIAGKIEASTRTLTYEVLKEIEKESIEMGARLYLMVIPSKALSMKNRCCKEDWLHQEVLDFAVENKIDFVNLAEAFSDQDEQHQLFFPVDIHLTEEGHAVVASSIIGSLRPNL